jgi:hypothetical protein
MTAHKHLKELVRSRMKKMGESYASARRIVIRQAARPPADPAARWHFPGNIAATTALRVLLAHAGVRNPHTGEPFSEAMLFGIAGGIGAGVFSFFYQKEGFASFFVAGRHLYQDDAAYLKQACSLFGIQPVVRETAGAKGAEKQLREMLTAYGPCVAWVDMAHLPHRAMPSKWSGGGYHVVTVYAVKDETATALIGDLHDEPISIPLANLATARSRIKSQKHRLLAIPQARGDRGVDALVRAGLRNCRQGLLGKGAKGPPKNSSLEAFRVWAKRMHGSKDRESWERIFTPGPRLWQGLTSIHDFIEHYGTGGGLCRPLFADFLNEAADALDDARLRALAGRYAELGREWCRLADAALPERVPLMREAKELCARRVELRAAGAPIDELRVVWAQLGELGGQAREKFPLSDAECDALRADLQRQIYALHEGEVAAHAALADAAG